MLGKSRLKYIQSLGQKKARDEEGVFVAEGPKLLDELLSMSHVQVKEIYGTKKWINENKVLIGVRDIVEVSDDELAKISQLSTPNQALAIIKKFDSPSIDVKNSLTIALDTIQDPGNLGTIIRIADWFGVTQMVCSMDCADMYNPKVVQATMGSIARVNILYTDLEEWVSQQKKVIVYAAVLDGEPVANTGKAKEGILLIGNESKGISPAVLQYANNKITIPRRGKAESLNAAIAAGIILSHISG
jgi:RNA methyltransferase, TrmH family